MTSTIYCTVIVRRISPWQQAGANGPFYVTVVQYMHIDLGNYTLDACVLTGKILYRLCFILGLMGSMKETSPVGFQ